MTTAFLDSLKQAGWVDGRNVIVEWREQQARGTAFAAGLVDELIRLPVDLIVVEDTGSVRAVAAATTQVPVVMIGMGGTTFPDGEVNPATSGFSATLARPGANITGTYCPQPIGKRLELTKTVFPNLTRVGVLRPVGTLGADESDAAARSLGMEPVDMPVRGTIDAGVFTSAAANVNAFVQTRNWGLLLGQSKRVATFALRMKLPGMFPTRGHVTNGGLMSYGFNSRAIVSRSTDYVDRILRGAKPADLPIQLPTEFDFVVNFTTARTLGVTFPPDALAQVTEWVE
jgi:putative ABC transport system substrate-binding protein